MKKTYPSRTQSFELKFSNVNIINGKCPVRKIKRCRSSGFTLNSLLKDINLSQLSRYLSIAYQHKRYQCYALNIKDESYLSKLQKTVDFYQYNSTKETKNIINSTDFNKWNIFRENLLEYVVTSNLDQIEQIILKFMIFYQGTKIGLQFKLKKNVERHLLETVKRIDCNDVYKMFFINIITYWPYFKQRTIVNDPSNLNVIPVEYRILKSEISKIQSFYLSIINLENFFNYVYEFIKPTQFKIAPLQIFKGYNHMTITNQNHLNFICETHDLDRIVSYVAEDFNMNCSSSVRDNCEIPDNRNYKLSRVTNCTYKYIVDNYIMFFNIAESVEYNSTKCTKMIQSWSLMPFHQIVCIEQKSNNFDLLGFSIDLDFFNK